jgi:hypothetical protein
MRTGLSTLVFGLLITGCASAPEVRSKRRVDPDHPIVRYHSFRAQSLAASISKRDDTSLLDKAANAEVLALAREQNCLARYTGDEGLAEKTAEMVDAYLELHEQMDAEPSFLLRVRAKQAIRDAESAGRGVISPQSLGCLPNSNPYRGRGGPRRSGTTRYTQRDYYGTGMPWNQHSRSVPGGVIR